MRTKKCLLVGRISKYSVLRKIIAHLVRNPVGTRLPIGMIVSALFMETKMQDPKMQESKLSVSKIVQGKNPRRYFDPKEMLAFEASIAAQGILQPILVRPIADGLFEIIAGERRWRSAKKILGDDYEIPVLIREMTDEQATAASASENIDRAAMSPAEEAESAALILGQSNGNYEEAAKRLGCSRTTLEKRLALMNCSKNVRDALIERKIPLGMAELFATATKEKQDIVLVKLLALPSLPTVQDFKKQLEQHSKSLAAAIFGKDECAGCQFNSTNQSQLFAETISDGHCTNGQCYDAKTEQELEIRSVALKDEFPTVKILRPGENFTLIKIVAEGATGVGVEQAKACHSCSNYGGVVSGLPDSLGKTYKNQCFDTACNSTKVAERIKAEKAAIAQSEVKAEASESGQDNKYDASGKTVAKAAAKTEATVKVSVTDPARVKEYRVKVWRKILVKEIVANEENSKVVLLALSLCGLARHISGTKLTQLYKKQTDVDLKTSGSGVIGEVLQALSTTDEAVKAKLHTALAASIESNIEETEMRQILTFLNVDMAAHWQLNKEYLDTMTKSEIDLIMDEIGLKAHLGKDYSKLMGGKKDDIVAALLKVEGFVYQGQVPKVMQYTL